MPSGEEQIFPLVVSTQQILPGRPVGSNQNRIFFVGFFLKRILIFWASPITPSFLICLKDSRIDKLKKPQVYPPFFRSKRKRNIWCENNAAYGIEPPYAFRSTIHRVHNNFIYEANYILISGLAAVDVETLTICKPEIQDCLLYRDPPDVYIFCPLSHDNPDHEQLHPEWNYQERGIRR